MRKNLITLAVLAPLAAFATVVHADTSLLRSAGTSSLNANAVGDSVTYSFSGLEFESFFFNKLAPLYGTLTSVSVRATLDSTEYYAWASDLTIYVSNTTDINSTPLLQVGGDTDIGAAEYHNWANGDSSAPGTTVIDAVALTTPITFTGATGRTAWLGYGYYSPGDLGTWSGSITLTGVSLTAAVPEPSSWALLAAGGIGVVGLARRRQRKQPR